MFLFYESLLCCPNIKKAFAPGQGGAPRAPGSEGLTRGIFLVTAFVWDVEGAVLNAARTYGLTEVYSIVRHTWHTGPVAHLANQNVSNTDAARVA